MIDVCLPPLRIFSAIPHFKTFNGVCVSGECVHISIGGHGPASAKRSLRKLSEVLHLGNIFPWL